MDKLMIIPIFWKFSLRLSKTGADHDFIVKSIFFLIELFSLKTPFASLLSSFDLCSAPYLCGVEKPSDHLKRWKAAALNS